MNAFRIFLIFMLSLASPAAFGNCAEKIDALDQRTKSTPPDARVAQLFSQVRETAIHLCKAGNNAAAMQTVQMLESLLQAPAEPARTPEPSGPTLNDMDYTGGHQPVERDSPNPWGSLLSTQVCDWLTADEIEQGLSLAVELKVQRSIWKCNYAFMMPNGRSATAFIFYVERHDDPDYPRESEAKMSTGNVSSQFEAFDPGTPLLNGYNSVRAPYLYVYPVNGISLWELTFLGDSPEKDVMFGSSPQPANLGKAFLSLLIDKHRSRISPSL